MKPKGAVYVSEDIARILASGRHNNPHASLPIPIWSAETLADKFEACILVKDYTPGGAYYINADDIVDIIVYDRESSKYISIWEVETLKTVMICALGYTKSDYHDYPTDWIYVDWSKRNIDSVIHQIRNLEYDRLVAHGLGCFIAVCAGIKIPKRTVFIEPYLNSFPKQSYVMQYVDMLPDFLFKLLAFDISIPYKNLKEIKASFFQVRQLSKRDLPNMPNIGLLVARSNMSDEVQATSSVVVSAKTTYAIPYQQWRDSFIALGGA